MDHEGGRDELFLRCHLLTGKFWLEALNSELFLYEAGCLILVDQLALPAQHVRLARGALLADNWRFLIAFHNPVDAELCGGPFQRLQVNGEVEAVFDPRLLRFVLACF